MELLNYTPKFFILAYPRSRTKWLSEALGGLHDGFLGCRSVWDLKEKMGGCYGNSDSANILFLDQLRTVFPDGRFLIVHRDPEEVIESMQRCRLDTSGIEDMTTLMDYARGFGYPEVKYDEIDTSGRYIWEHTRPDPFDPSRWNALSRQHIQVDMPEYLLRVEREQDALDELCRQMSFL